jgi:O-antigen ligase
MLRLAPLGVVMIFVIQGMSPGALSAIRYQLLPGKVTSSTSTQGRTADYHAVAPDIKTHLATGRGYGTYDSHKYRLLDNQYLLLLIETGVLGLAAFVAMVLAVVRVAHPVIRSGDPVRGPPALACAAVAFAMLVATTLFDILSFPQLPYLFLFIAALAAVSAAAAREPGPVAPR